MAYKLLGIYFFKFFEVLRNQNQNYFWIFFGSIYLRFYNDTIVAAIANKNINSNLMTSNYSGLSIDAQHTKVSHFELNKR